MAQELDNRAGRLEAAAMEIAEHKQLNQRPRRERSSKPKGPLSLASSRIMRCEHYEDNGKPPLPGREAEWRAGSRIWST